jgi:hypothetical protein
MTEEKFKKGDLVMDADPYKAPEIHYGYGVILEIIDADYVVVYWPKYNIQTVTGIEYIAKIVEENT